MSTIKKILATPRLRLLLALALVAVAVLTVGFRDKGSTDLVAWFPSTDGIYAGDEVRVLGVPVGKIDSIDPDGTKVRVAFHVNSDIKIPKDAKAVIVAPSLVSSRYLQLTPRYDGGPVMADGSTIELADTAVPVEWDDIKEQLNGLAEALGPRGANKNGALSDLVDAGSTALDGQGATINQTIADLSNAVGVLDSGGDDAFSVVRNLQVFVAALAQSDGQMKRFIQNLDAVSAVLVDDKRMVRSALRNLSAAVGDVEGFIKDNRAGLNTAVTRLSDIVQVVNKQQGDLAQILHVAPNALENLTESYHENQNAVGVNLNSANIFSPGSLICGAIGGAAGTDEAGTEKLCNDLLGNLLGQVVDNPQSQELLDALLLLIAGAGS
ncbi:MCE family protein [Nocardioides sp. WS12]|uniref:MCE family protein n=1 Tax=Nocardioides sp. WS12 TaxID=2486272 RepID=UPI0015FBA701|nr:MCE family protein [Nocardioides sp. WS12]